MTKRLAAKHPRVARWTHWLSFPLLALMAWSGLKIYWADPAYLRLPQGFYHALGLDYSLAEGLAVHFFVGWLFALNGLVYAAYTLLSGEWRQLIPRKESWRESVQVVLHDLHLTARAPAQGRYNAAQRIAYTAVVLMGAGSVLTGLAIYKPVQLGRLARLLGGYERARLAHFWLMVGFAAFFVVHVLQVARAGWNNFRSMVAGVELVEDRRP
jgi:thiosulfate reductase cytochrome b subunit